MMIEETLREWQCKARRKVLLLQKDVAIDHSLIGRTQ
jgi:hypothetical protein